MEGRDYPVYVAAYTHYLPEPFLAAGAASGGAIARLTVSTLARRIAADARRSRNCSLFHLCPICEGILTRKSTLKGHFPLALELCLLTECASQVTSKHMRTRKSSYATNRAVRTGSTRRRYSEVTSGIDMMARRSSAVLACICRLLPIRVASHFQVQHCTFSNQSKLMCAIMLAIYELVLSAF